MPAKTDESLAKRLLDGDKRALARAITLIENDDPAGWELVREVYPQTGKARIVGLTGPPGVGKSTLIGALTKEMREAERQVAVLSIDPSSPFTRGALLGDRIRLSDHFLDSGVFIRSMASRGALGGLSEATLQAALLMDASGKDDVFIETVGVGQAEIDIVDHGDTVVLVLMPGSGDSIQALKAGVMEIPDIIVVNKADHPMTDTMVREIRGVLSLGPATSWRVPILRTEAARGEGAAELAERIGEHRAHIEAEGTLEERRARNLRNEVLELAAARMRRGWMRRSPATPRSPRCWSGWCGASSTPPAPRPSCWSAGMAEGAGTETGQSPPRRQKLPSLDDAEHWIGLRVDGVGGRTIGRVAGIHVDAEDGEPRWTVLRVGPIGGCTAIPFAHVAEGAGRLWAGYERDWVREAPRFKANEALTADNELELCAHWGIRDGYGRAAESPIATPTRSRRSRPSPADRLVPPPCAVCLGEPQEEVPMLLEGKNAIVYGAAGSIGGAVSRAFAAEGATVHLAGRTAETLEALAEEIRAAGGSAETAVVDALDERQVDEHADGVASGAGSLDISMNVITHPSTHGTPLWEMKVDDFMDSIDVAARTTFITTRAATRNMIPRKRGVILAFGGPGDRRGRSATTSSAAPRSPSTRSRRSGGSSRSRRGRTESGS